MSLCLLHQYVVCVCVCVCVYARTRACTHTHACVSVMSLLRVCVHVYVWFNMTCDCFSSPLLSFHFTGTIFQFHHYAASFGKLRIMNSLMDIVKVKSYEIWGSLSHSNVPKSLLVCYTRSDGKYLLMFQRRIVSSSSWNA